MDEKLFSADAYEAALAERRRLLDEHFAIEGEAVERAASARAERVRWWEDMVTESRKGAWREQLSAYKSLAGSMASLLGGSVREQAKIMVPFEVAEATKEFARFLGTRDPKALASSLKHTLAARRYGKVAGSGGASSGQGGGGGGGTSAGSRTPETPEQRSRTSRVVVNVDRRVGVLDTYEFARGLIDAINENISDDVVLEANP